MKVTLTRCGAKPNVSPPGYAASRLRPATPVHYLLYANAIYRMSLKISSVDNITKTGCHGNVPRTVEKLISD